MSKITEQATLTIIGLTHAHHKIHSVNSFEVCDVNDLANGATFDYLMTTPDTAKWGHLVFQIQAEREASYQIFENPTISAVGTAMTENNRNRNSSNTAGIAVTHTPTVTSTGSTIICEEHWLSGASAASRQQDRGIQEFLLKQDEQYLIRITNETALANQVSISISFYEHENFNVGDRR